MRRIHGHSGDGLDTSRGSDDLQSMTQTRPTLALSSLSLAAVKSTGATSKSTSTSASLQVRSGLKAGANYGT